MKLFKNVDIKDLESILNDGILPISKTGNDDWENGNRAENSKDVVYLFNAKNGSSFTNYGLALIEVEVEATRNEMSENDVNQENYVEYVCSEVKPSQILNVYLPKFVDYKDSRVKKVNYSATTYVIENGEIKKVNLDGELKAQFEKTAPTSTSKMNYLRGKNLNGTMIDTKNWFYEI